MNDQKSTEIFLLPGTKSEILFFIMNWFCTNRYAVVLFIIVQKQS